jgi:hypothetical protein
MKQLAAILADCRRESEFYEKCVGKAADPISYHDAVWNPELAAQWSDDRWDRLPERTKMPFPSVDDETGAGKLRPYGIVITIPSRPTTIGPV